MDLSRSALANSDWTDGDYFNRAILFVLFILRVQNSDRRTFRKFESRDKAVLFSLCFGSAGSLAQLDLFLLTAAAGAGLAAGVGVHRVRSVQVLAEYSDGNLLQGSRRRLAGTLALTRARTRSVAVLLLAGATRRIGRRRFFARFHALQDEAGNGLTFRTGDFALVGLRVSRPRAENVIDANAENG